MATYTWIGLAGSAFAETITTDWAPTGQPASDDTAIVNAGGSIILGDGQFKSNTFYLNGGAAGVTADPRLTFTGDQLIRFLPAGGAAPSLDPASTITTAAAPGNVAAVDAAIIDALGNFINEGSLVAAGPVGSSLTINVGATTINGTLFPGYFFNPGLIQANSGNTLTISVGATSEMFNSGSIVANGGTVVIKADPSAIAGGYGAVRGFEVIKAGGTIETAAFFPASDANNGTHEQYEFADSTAGNTLKIDNIGSFGGAIIGFSAGDTIDLGTHLSVGTVAYSTATNLLSLEAANGATLATLLLGNIGSGYATGSFAVTNGTADGFIIGVGADGNTVLTSAIGQLNTSGTSGAWQSSGSWIGGVIPGTTAVAAIGLGATSPFTLTTGASPVSVGGFAIWSPFASVQITSNTTLTTGQVADYAGTLDIAAGNTLTGGAIQLYLPTASFTIEAGATAALAGRLNVDLAPAGGIWALQPGSNPFALSAAAGTTTINGALLAGPTATTRGGSVSIAYESAGLPSVVTVNPGGTVTDTHTVIGSDPTSAGTLTINGATWIDMVDNADTFNSRGYMTIGYNDIALNTPAGTPAPTAAAPAVLVVENNGTLTEQEGASIASTLDSAGQVTVETGAVWNIGSPGRSTGIGVGVGGSGTLSVLSGGTVNTWFGGPFLSDGTTFTAGGIGIGQSVGATGSVIVSGVGSEFYSAKGMSVGQSGQGLLDVSNGGTVLMQGGTGGNGIGVGQTVAAGSSGTVEVGGPGASAVLNFLPASSSAATGSIAAASGMSVGNVTNGTLIVSDNGTINMNGTGGITVGNSSNSFGTVSVGGSTAAAVINLGSNFLTVGNSGTGTATVGGLGTIAITTGGFTVGGTAGAVGALSVNGGRITETSATGGSAVVGQTSGASASFMVNNGGVFSDAGSSLIIGNNVGANGTVTVQGAGSSIQMTNTAGVNVGNFGTGTLTIGGSGSLGISGTGALVVGAGSGSHGTVADNGGSISANSITVGQFGTATLAISGGTVTDNSLLVIGANAGSSGTVSVSGLGSALNATGGIEVGGGGAGTLTIQGESLTTPTLTLGGSATAPLGTGVNRASLTATADLTVTGALAIWQGSTLSLDSTSGIDAGTSGSFVAGAVNVENGQTIFGNGVVAAAVVNNGLILASGSHVVGASTLEITGAIGGAGAITLAPSSILRLDGALGSSQTISFGAGGGETLILNAAPGTITNAISGLNIGDRIEFQSVTSISNVQVSAGTVTVTTNLGAYVLNNVSFAAGVFQSFIAYLDGSTGFWNIQVAPQGENWIVSANTDLGTAGNWSNGTAPTAIQAINFDGNTGGLLTGTGTGIQANFNGAGAWILQSATLNLAGEPSPPVQPFALQVNGTLVVNGGSLTAVGSGNVNGPSGAALTAQGGAQVTTLGMTLGGAPGQEGSLLVTGAGTTWKDLLSTNPTGSGGFLTIGYSAAVPGGLGGGVGHLTVTANASLIDSANDIIATNAGSEGDVTVSAGGSLSNAGMTVGNGGNGTLTVNGGSVNDGGMFWVGNNSGSSGIVNVASATLSAAGNINIGLFGAGTVTLGQSAVFNATSSAFAAIGNLAGSSGTMIINSGGTFASGTTTMAIGDQAGSEGELIINSGGTHESTVSPQVVSAVLAIGGIAATSTQPASSGSVLVTGAGALLNTNGNQLLVADNNGQGGQGSLTVAQGGSVVAGSADNNVLAALQIAAHGGTGVITITDPGSRITSNGYVLDARGGSGTLNIRNFATLVVNDSPLNGGGVGIGAGRSPSPTSSAAVGGNGVANVTGGGQLILNSATSVVTVGGNGVNGILNVNTGGTVVTGAGLTVGTATTANGTLYAGTGSVNIGAGGTVLVSEAPQTNSFAVEIGTANTDVGLSTADAGGSVLVSGTGALLNTNGNGIEVGRMSNGVLAISQGGSVVSGTPDSTLISAMTVGRFGSGAVTISDPGSAMTGNGSINIGRGGVGSLLIENGGKLTSTPDGKGLASIAIGSGSDIGTSVVVGGSGNALVTSGGYMLSQQRINVGSDGIAGQLTVDNGGTAEAMTWLTIGNSASFAAGTSIISQAGTTIATAGTILSGEGVVNIGAGGVLKVDGSGITTVGTSAINLASGVGSTGTLNVSGAGAIVNTNGYQIGVGAAGQSGMLISLGGAVLAGTPFASDEAIYIGGSAGATGALTVTDPGSKLLATGQISVGLNGQGSLLVENQATVTTGNNIADTSEGFEIGQNTGANGTATVIGSKSVLQNVGRFIVGDAGIGGLSIQAGGTVTTAPGSVAGLAGLVIANTASASGSAVNVTGAGSNLQSTGSLIVGNAGFGQLSIAEGGTVDGAALTEGAAAGGSGVVSVAGTGSGLNLTGVLNIGGLAPGELSILSAGEVTAGSVTIGAGAGGAGNLVIGAGSTLTVTGTATPLVVGVSAAAVLNIQGGTLVLSGSPTFGANGRLVQVGGLIDPAPTLTVAGNAYGGGAVDEASVEVLNTATSIAKAPDIAGGSATFLAPSVTGGSASKPGIWNIDTGGTLVLDVNAVAATQEFTFADATGVLEIGQQVSVDASGTPQTIDSAAIGGFQGLIDSYVTGDQIIVETTAAAGFGYVSGGTTITVNDLVDGAPTGAQEGALVFTDAGAAAQAFADLTNSTASFLDQMIPCFAGGTLIDTVAGPRPVEMLAVGDEVVTLLGGHGRIVWIGHRSIDCTRHPRPETVWPVRIAAEAFGRGAPDRDLFLSPDHAVYWMDRLVPVKLLVNGATIRQVARRTVTYYHVELERHDIMLAEGLPAESYLDTGNRGMFEAEGQPLILHPDFATGQRGRETLSCAPFADQPDEVEPVWWDLADRAEAMGWRLPEPPELTDDPDLHVVMGARRINPVVTGQGCYRFVLPVSDAPIRLVSRTARPCDARPWIGDDRVLGVAISRIRLRHGSEVVDLALDGPGPESGWYDAERERVRMWRWTNGDAVLRLPSAVGHNRVLELTISGGMSYALRAAADGAPERLAAVA